VREWGREMIIQFPCTIEQRLMRMFEHLELMEYKPVGWFYRLGF